MIRKYRKSFALCFKATSLLVSLSSGYGRAFAGTCTGSGGSYLCSGAANPIADTTVIINIAQPLTVTTSSDFGIDTTSNGGDAFNLRSSGGLTFIDHNSLAITGKEHGIFADNNGNSSLLLSTTAAVTGGRYGIGIWANNSSSSGADLTITTANVTGGDDGINANNLGSGHLWITSTGSIEGTYDNGILANNYGTDLTITTAQITGGAHGIVATNHGTSSLSITATDTVGGTNGIGIWANNFGTDLTITAAEVSGGDNGILATNSGSGHLWITTSGPVSGLSAHGIVATNHGNSDLSITTTDTVTGGASGIGIWANNSSSSGKDLTITTANVTGGDDGINAHNSGTGQLSINTTGTVTSTGNGDLAMGIYAINDGSGALSISASGSVTSMGTGAWAMGIYARNSSNGTDLAITTAGVTGGYAGIAANNQGHGALSITASGNIIGTGMGTGPSGHGYGIYANNSVNGTNLIISAAGVSSGVDGIKAINSGSGSLSISASGTVTGASNGAISANNSSTGTDLTISAASVTGATDGIFARNEGSGALSISSSGTVTGNSYFGIWAENYNAGTDLSLETANVTGGVYGILAFNFGSGALSISSSGTVTGTSLSGISAWNVPNGTDLTISTANVSGATAGIFAIHKGSGALSISSSGAVTGTSGYGVSARNYGTDLTIETANASGATAGIFARNFGSGALSITASGTVTGTSQFGIRAYNDGGQPTTINVGEQSLVQGGDAGLQVASTTGQSATLNVSGQVRNLSGLTTDNAIISNDGPTTVNLFAGSDTTGIISLSNFSDTVTLAGTLNGSVTMNDGNDTFIQVGGSTLTGTADGGGGNDTLGFNNVGTVDNGLLGTTYFNFENLGIYGGSTTLTGVWNFSTGTATIYQGNLYVDGTLISSQLTVESGGWLIDNGTLASGTLDIQSGGLADINGTATIAGDTTVGGLLNVNSGGLLTTDTLTVNSGGTASIWGTANVHGVTDIFGSLSVDGSLATSQLTVEHGGLLVGNGSIFGNVTILGTVSPGHSLGTLNIDGSVSFMPGSVYLAETRSNGSSDRIDVSGQVSLHGGTVKTALSRSLYTDGQNWKILSASGGIRGKFSGLSYNRSSETVDLQLAYNSKQVLLEIVRTPFASFGMTPAGKAVGAGLDEIVPLADGSMAGFITAMDFDMSRPQIENVLNALSPEMYTSFSAAGLRSAGVFDQATAQHQAEFRQGRALGLASLSEEDTKTSGEWTVWSRALGNWSERDSEAGSLGYNQQLGGFVAGTDRQFAEGLRGGLDLGYTDSDLEWSGTGHSGSLSGRHIGLYASSEPGNFFIDAAIGYSDFTANAERIIAFDGLSAGARSGFDADAWAGRLEGGYNFTISNWLLSPVASLNYARLAQDGFSEYGADFLNLDIAATDTASLTSTLGARISGLIATGQWQYMPRLDLRWLHQFEDEAATVTANFINYETASFDVTGIAAVPDQGTLSLGLTGQYGKSLSLYVDYGVALADGYTSQLVSGGLSWKF